MPQVSVIIPVYNRETFIAECLDSVLNQTFQDFEIIIVDDGSSDNSVDICRQYEAKDARIKLLMQEHKGVSAARNLGLDNAGGEFVYFLDSDDKINNIFLEAACENALENGSDVVFIDFKDFDWSLTIDNVISTANCALFYRKSFLDYTGIRFTEGMILYEDSLFTFEVLCLTDKRSLCLNAVYNYRRHSQSISETFLMKDAAESLGLYLKELKIYLDKYQLRAKYSKRLKVFLEYIYFKYSLKDILYKRKIYYLLKNFYYDNMAEYITPEEYNGLHFLIRRLVGSPNFLVYEIKDTLLKNKFIHILYLKLR